MSKGGARKSQIQPPKEFKMFSRRLFNIVVAVALLVVIGLTIREAAATTLVVSQTSSERSVCDSLPSRYSIHTEYMPERGAWVISTEDGPTGIDGGLIQLLSDFRACS
jgi:hypothetical protein